jgi:hypothetical protein
VSEGWQQILEMQPGDIAIDQQRDVVRVLIMRGYGALCAYVGVPIGHPLAGFAPEDILLDCHGGCNFSTGASRPELPYPEGWYWYGWSYDHHGDYRTDHDVFPPAPDPDAKRWTVRAVEIDIVSTVYEFERLVKLAEAVAVKAMGWRAQIGERQS